MSEAKTGAPWHLWVVGVIALLWNAFGCYDFYMTTTGGEEYLRSYGMTEEMIAYFSAMPGWLTPAWAIGVGGGALGAILLLLRKKLALPVFVVSFVAYLITVIYQYGMSNGGAVVGQQGVIMSVIIAAICLFLIWYASAMSRRGVLG